MMTSTGWRSLTRQIKLAKIFYEYSSQLLNSLLDIHKHDNTQQDSKYACQQLVWRFTLGQWKDHLHDGQESFDSGNPITFAALSLTHFFCAWCSSSSCCLDLCCVFIVLLFGKTATRMLILHTIFCRTFICFNPSSFLLFINLDKFLAFLDLVICICDAQILCSVSLTLHTFGQLGYPNWPNCDVSRPFKAL